MVVSFSKVSFTVPTIFLRCVLTLFDCRLPQPTKVWGVLGYELPLNILSGTKLRYIALSDLTLQELIELLQFAIRTN